MSEPKSRLVGIVSPPYQARIGQVSGEEHVGHLGSGNNYSTAASNIGNLPDASRVQGELDIEGFCGCGELYWFGCYEGDARWKRFVTAESFAHPAKMSWALLKRIYDHLEVLGLLKPDDTVIDFMAGSGKTSVMAGIRGYRSVNVELEPPFVKMIRDNKVQTEKILKRGVNTEILQGDARNLSSLLTEKGYVGIISPPYGECGIGDFKNKRETFVKWIQNELVTKGFIEWRGKRYTEREWRDANYGRIDGRVMEGSPKMGTEGYNPQNPSNIGNLPDKPSLVGITSPPYEAAHSAEGNPGGIVSTNRKDLQKYLYTKGNQGVSEGQIGNLKDISSEAVNVFNIPISIILSQCRLKRHDVRSVENHVIPAKVNKNNQNVEIVTYETLIKLPILKNVIKKYLRDLGVDLNLGGKALIIQNGKVEIQDGEAEDGNLSIDKQKSETTTHAKNAVEQNINVKLWFTISSLGKKAGKQHLKISLHSANPATTLSTAQILNIGASTYITVRFATKSIVLSPLDRGYALNQDAKQFIKLENTIAGSGKNKLYEQQSYLSEMQKVYSEAFKSGVSPLVVVTKNPTRKGQLRRLDLDTARILLNCGYTIIDYHRAVLFRMHEQATLDGQKFTNYKGRLSFFKRLSLEKGNVAAQWEDILIAAIPNTHGLAGITSPPYYQQGDKPNMNDRTINTKGRIYARNIYSSNPANIGNLPDTRAKESV